jgi:K+-transporting ATPase ATPase C chain
MYASIRALVVSLAVLTILTGIGYPLLTYGLAQVLFPSQANGSLLKRDGRVIGSLLIGQNFDEARYFWGRPSAIASGPYDAASSSGSNLAPSNPALALAVASRSDTLAKANGKPNAPIPLDLLTASGSGLDPHLTVAAAYYQIDRVAAARGLDPSVVRSVVDRHIESPLLGFLGQRHVNVLAINLALDDH